MTATDLLADLRRRGIRLEAHGDRLRYRPASATTPGDIAALRAFKTELLGLIAVENTLAVFAGARVVRASDIPAGLVCGVCGGNVWDLAPPDRHAFGRRRVRRGVRCRACTERYG